LHNLAKVFKRLQKLAASPKNTVFMLIIFTFACLDDVIGSHQYATYMIGCNNENIMLMTLQICARFYKLLQIFVTFFFITAALAAHILERLMF